MCSTVFNFLKIETFYPFQSYLNVPIKFSYIEIRKRRREEKKNWQWEKGKRHQEKN